MAYQKDYDTIFQDLLTAWTNQFPGVDISQGSMVYMQSAVIASALWGEYQHMEWIKRQIFVDTADTENIDHDGAIFLIPRKTDESDADYSSRLVGRRRNPPAGGNNNDYRAWAISIQDVRECYVFPLAQGLGTVDIVPIADKVLTGLEVPTPAKIAEIAAYIETVRPVGMSNIAAVNVQTVVLQLENVTMTTTGTGFTDAKIEADITAYMNSLEPKETLYVSRLVGIAIAAGADSAVVTVPAANIVPTLNVDMIRPGTITVNP